MDNLDDQLQKVADAYNNRATEYSATLGNIDATSSIDQAQIRQWALNISGFICDLGCGPGHWTNFLHATGLPVCGFDPSEGFLEIARTNFPYLRFTHGTANDLPACSFDGVLAWYSLIHTRPEKLHGDLLAIAKALKPGGHLLIGFFTSNTVKSFDHAIVKAWSYPIVEMDNRLRQAGFTPVTAHSRHDTNTRPHGSIEAVLNRD